MIGLTTCSIRTAVGSIEPRRSLYLRFRRFKVWNAGACAKIVDMLNERSFVPFTRQLQQRETDAPGPTRSQNRPIAALHNYGKPPGLKPGSNCVLAT
jgi:hypothetical protein